MNEAVIEASRLYVGPKYESERLAKRDKCMRFVKPTSRFCNSLAVLQFILKNIIAEEKLVFKIPLWEYRHVHFS